MQENVSFMFFLVHMEISVRREDCFTSLPVKHSYRDGNFDSHLKPMKDTYNHLLNKRVDITNTIVKCYVALK